MKQFSLEEYIKDPSRKVVTRDGKAVKIHCTNYIGAQHIIAQVEGYDYSTSFTKNGRYANDREDSQLDLFFAPEKHEGWVSLYKNLRTGSIYCDENIYGSKEEAEKQHGIAIAKVEWEE